MKWFNELDKKKRQIIVIPLFAIGAILLGLVWVADFNIYLLVPALLLIVFSVALQVDADKYDKKKEEENIAQLEEQVKERYISDDEIDNRLAEIELELLSAPDALNMPQNTNIEIAAKQRELKKQLALTEEKKTLIRRKMEIMKRDNPDL